MSHSMITNENAGIKQFRLDMIIRALDLEIRTGMKLARNQPTLKALREQYGVTGRTKIAVLDELLALRDEIREGTFDPFGLPG